MNVRMMFLSFFFACIAPSFAGSAEPKASAKTLTLDQAVDYALQNAFSVKIAQASVSIAHEQVTQSKGALGPQVAVQGTYVRYSQSSKARLPIGPGGAFENVTLSPIQDELIKATLQLPIDILGVLSKSVQAASSNAKSVAKNFDANHNNVKAQVRAAYYNVLQAKELVEVAKESLKDAELLLKNTQAKFDAGTVPKYNVLQFEVQVQQSKANLYNAEALYKLSKQSLNNVMGRPILTPFEPVALEKMPIIKGKDELYLQYALEHRPEVQAAQYQVESATQNKTYQAYGMTPSLGLGGAYTRDFNPGGLGGNPSIFVATATLNIPVYDSGITNARVQTAKAQLEQAKVQFDQVSLSVQLQVDQSLVNLRNAFLQVDVARKSKDYAEATYAAAKASYDAGVNVLLDLLDSYTQLVQSRTALVNARYSYLSSYAALQQAAGTDDLEKIDQEKIVEKVS